MLPVISVNLLAILLAFCAKDRRLQGCFKLAFVILTIFYGIRFDFGNDYWSYKQIFDECSSVLDFDINIEPGWSLLCFLCRPIGFFGLVILVTIVENVIVYKIISRHVDRHWWWFAVFIYVFTFNFLLLGCSMMRQYLAMLLCVWASSYIAKRHLFAFLIYVGLAISMHFTAIIMLPMYIFAYIRPKLNSPWFMGAFGGVVCVLVVVTNQLSDVLEFAVQFAFLEDYSNYLGWDEGVKSLGLVVEFTLLYLVMLKYPQNHILQVCFCVLLISFLILPFSFALVMLVRLMLFFSVFSIICYPEVFKSLKRKWVSFPILLFYIFYTFRRFINTYTGETYGEAYKHYRTILDAVTWM